MVPVSTSVETLATCYKTTQVKGDRYCLNSEQNDKANELMSSYNGCFSVASSNPATIPEKDLHTTTWSHGLRQDSHTERCTAISRVPWPLDFFPKQCYGLSCSALLSTPELLVEITGISKLHSL